MCLHIKRSHPFTICESAQKRQASSTVSLSGAPQDKGRIYRFASRPVTQKKRLRGTAFSKLDLDPTLVVAAIWWNQTFETTQKFLF